jgi:hypothetical protein
MLYVIIGEDHPGTLDQRMAARPSHVERLQALQAEARLILAGPCPAIDSPTPARPAFPAALSLPNSLRWLPLKPGPMPTPTSQPASMPR